MEETKPPTFLWQKGLIQQGKRLKLSGFHVCRRPLITIICKLTNLYYLFVCKGHEIPGTYIRKIMYLDPFCTSGYCNLKHLNLCGILDLKKKRLFNIYAGNGITGEEFERTPPFPLLESLNLSHNQIGPSGMTVFKDILIQSTQLESIDISCS